MTKNEFKALVKDLNEVCEYLREAVKQAERLYDTDPDHAIELLQGIRDDLVHGVHTDFIKVYMAGLSGDQD